MSINRPEVIAEDNLSFAWGRAFLRMMSPDSSHAPLTLTVEGFSEDGFPMEHPGMRSAVDKALSINNFLTVDKTAFTIFPNDNWEYFGRPPHANFGSTFRRRIFPFMHRMDRRNRSGTYFQRMVAFGAEIEKGELEGEYTDQIEKILTFWKRPGSHRRSAFQLACFDPNKDHHLKPRSGFPCLQQVSLSYDTHSRGLAITGFYPSEFIFDRGYGNYLGLCHLGRYLAINMGLKLIRMNCVIAHPLLGVAAGKTKLRALEAQVRSMLPEVTD